MTQITTTGGMITFLDTVTGLSKQIGQNQLWLQFSTRGDTVNFLRISIPTDGSDGTPFWSARASDLTIDGESYTIEQLKSGAGTDGLFSTMSFSYEIVEELPETGEPNIIYLVYDDETGTYTEYLWLAQEQTYEVLGSVADIDLGNYYTKSQTDTLLAAKADASSLATVATSGAYSDLSGTPTIPTVPTNVSAFTNDAGYLTEHQSLSNYYDKTQTDNLLAGKQATLTAGANITIENNVISATGGGGSADLTNYYTKTETDTLLNTKANTSSLATVATSGAYSDLSGTPTNVSAFTNDAGYLTSHQSLADVFGDVLYDSQTKHINFYGKGDTSHTTVLAYVDAANFIVDGMVDTVEVKNATVSGQTVLCLVISFNTDAGKQDINIPISQIFDATNYYTKSETDTLLSAKASTSSLATVATSGSYNDLTNKPTIPDFDYYSETTTQSTKMGKIDTIENNVGSKVEVGNASIDLDVQGSTTNTSVGLTTTSISATIQGSGYNRSFVEVQPGYMDISFETDDYDTSGFRFGFDASGNMIITRDDEDRVAMVSELSDYATTSAMNTALAGKQATLVSGTNIKTINNQSLLGSGNITIEGGSQITVDTELSSTSTNPVENRAIYAVVGDIEAALQAINGTANA